MTTHARFAALLWLALALPASAEYIEFDATSDTIDVAGQTVLGGTSTFEAVVMFPSGTGAYGAIFMEHLAFFEDKFLFAGPDVAVGYVYNVAGSIFEATSLALAPDVFHHVAYVVDEPGLEERLYVDGQLEASRAVAPAFDALDGDGTAHIGATDRDGGVTSAFIGFLDSVRISDVARYTGASFTPPTGDMTSDANTLLLYNFDEAAGSPTVADSGPLARTGTLGQGFGGATAPETGANPNGNPDPELDTFLCYKTKQTKGDVCSVASAQNAGAACDAEEDCGGNAETDFCVPNKLTGISATLTDPLGKLGRQVAVTKGTALCNPANKNNGGIDNPDDHLRSFGIKLVKGQPSFETGDLAVENQFGNVLLATSKVDRLLVPAAKDPAAPVAAPETPAIDHFRCQKAKIAKGEPRFEPISAVSVVDQFAQPKVYDLKKPTRVCTPVDKNGEGVLHPGTVLLCYQAKKGRGQAKHVKQVGLHVAHQFGVERVDTVKEEELCVPSTVVVVD